jgi:hypothetical protein
MSKQKAYTENVSVRASTLNADLSRIAEALNDGASLQSFTLNVHGSQFDPCPEKPDDVAFTAYDLLCMLRMMPVEALKTIVIEADSSGEMGYMAPVTKSEMTLKLRTDGTGSIEVFGNEFARHLKPVV